MFKSINNLVVKYKLIIRSLYSFKKQKNYMKFGAQLTINSSFKIYF